MYNEKCLKVKKKKLKKKKKKKNKGKKKERGGKRKKNIKNGLYDVFKEFITFTSISNAGVFFSTFFANK